MRKNLLERTYSLCSNGQVRVPPISEPPLLEDLSPGDCMRSHHFRQYVQAYKLSFEFASMSLTGEEYKFANPGRTVLE